MPSPLAQLRVGDDAVLVIPSHIAASGITVAPHEPVHSLQDVIGAVTAVHDAAMDALAALAQPVPAAADVGRQGAPVADGDESSDIGSDEFGDTSTPGEPQTKAPRTDA